MVLSFSFFVPSFFLHKHEAEDIAVVPRDGFMEDLVSACSYCRSVSHTIYFFA